MPLFSSKSSKKEKKGGGGGGGGGGKRSKSAVLSDGGAEGGGGEAGAGAGAGDGGSKKKVSAADKKRERRRYLTRSLSGSSKKKEKKKSGGGKGDTNAGKNSARSDGQAQPSSGTHDSWVLPQENSEGARSKSLPPGGEGRPPQGSAAASESEVGSGSFLGAGGNSPRSWLVSEDGGENERESGGSAPTSPLTSPRGKPPPPSTPPPLQARRSPASSPASSLGRAGGAGLTAAAAASAAASAGESDDGGSEFGSFRSISYRDEEGEAELDELEQEMAEELELEQKRDDAEAVGGGDDDRMGELPDDRALGLDPALVPDSDDDAPQEPNVAVTASDGGNGLDLFIDDSPAAPPPQPPTEGFSSPEQSSSYSSLSETLSSANGTPQRVASDLQVPAPVVDESVEEPLPNTPPGPPPKKAVPGPPPKKAVPGPPPKKAVPGPPPKKPGPPPGPPPAHAKRPLMSDDEVDEPDTSVDKIEVEQGRWDDSPATSDVDDLAVRPRPKQPSLMLGKARPPPKGPPGVRPPGPPGRPKRGPGGRPKMRGPPPKGVRRAAAPPPPPKVASAPAPPPQAEYVGSVPIISPDLLPPMITESVKFLRENSLQVSGLFRESANATLMKDLKQRYEKGQTGVLAAKDVRDDHTIAGLYKVYYRDMHQPIIPRDVAVALTGAFQAGSFEGMRQALGMLSEDAFNHMCYLFLFLGEVAAESEVNMMLPRNLGICWAPTLFRSGGQMTDVVALLITHYEQCFAR